VFSIKNLKFLKMYTIVTVPLGGERSLATDLDSTDFLFFHV
jgi:hypothetical protein